MTEKITTAEELDALPVGSVVLDADYDVMHKVWGIPRDEADYWAHVGSEHPSVARLPAAVLWPLPDAPAPECRDCGRSDGGCDRDVEPANPNRQEATR